MLTNFIVDFNIIIYFLEHTFKKFLQQHIQLAFSKGFDDNVGRHLTPAHFEVFLN